MTRIRMRTIFIKLDLEGNQAVQTEIHPLDVDGRQTGRRSSWLKPHHITEVQILMREIIVLHVSRVEQKLPSAKENTSHQIITGETLRIGYVFKKRIDHDFLLHRVPNTCNHGNNKGEFECLRPSKLFREKLVLFVCPLETTCPKAMSQLLHVLGDNKSSQSQIASISSYFKAKPADGKTSATQTTREGTLESLDTVEEKPHPAEEEALPPAPLSHGKRDVIKNLIKRSGKILSKKRKKTPIENKDLYGYIMNSDRQGTSSDNGQCQSTDSRNVDMSEAVHKNREKEHQVEKDFKDTEQTNNLGEGSDIKLESIDLQVQTKTTMCGDTSYSSMSDHVNANRGFDTDVTVYSEEQLKDLGIDMDIIPVQSSSSVSIIPVNFAACMSSHSDLSIDDSVLPHFDFLEKTDGVKIEDISDNSRHRNSDLVQHKVLKNLDVEGYSDSEMNHTHLNSSPQTLDVIKAQTNKSSEEDELESLKENSKSLTKSVNDASQRKKHLVPNLSPASSSSESDCSDSRSKLKQTSSKNPRKRKNLDDENLTEMSFSSKCIEYGMVDNNEARQSERGRRYHKKDDLPSIACPKRRTRKQHANNETINDSGDLPKLSSSQNKRRKIFTDISQNKATSGEGVSVYDFDLQEEGLSNLSSPISGSMSPRKQTTVSNDLQLSGVRLLPKLSRPRSKMSQPKSKKQATLDFFSRDNQKEGDDSNDECTEADDLDNESFDCVLLEQLSDLPKVKNEASQDLLHEIRNVGEVSELNEEQLRFLVLETRQYLKDIFEGKIMCDRHDRYKQGGLQRKNLNYHVHLGLFTEEQQDVVMETLMSIFCKKNHRFLEYIMKVLLPEMLIKIHMEVHGSSHSETEEIMQDVLRKPGGIHI